jgi:hypothetical protein
VPSWWLQGTLTQGKGKEESNNDRPCPPDWQEFRSSRHFSSNHKNLVVLSAERSLGMRVSRLRSRESWTHAAGAPFRDLLCSKNEPKPGHFSQWRPFKIAKWEKKREAERRTALRLWPERGQRMEIFHYFAPGPSHHSTNPTLTPHPPFLTSPLVINGNSRSDIGISRFESLLGHVFIASFP